MFIFGFIPVYAQIFPEKGVPPLERFTPLDYHNAGKVWDIHSAPNGIVYMAADRGLLEYDGASWKHFQGSRGFTRSVLVVNDSLIYTGSDLDFGVWERNKYQGFEYTSLYPFQEDLQDINEEFWQIYHFRNDILFISSQSIYIYRNQQLVKIAAPSQFKGNFLVDDSLYFLDKNNGLFLFDGFSLRKILDFPEADNTDIAGAYQKDNDLVIVTRDAGLYIFSADRLMPMNTELSVKLKGAKVFSFEQVGSNHVAFGTVLKGLYIADLAGNVIHHVNRHKGLPSNTILSLHYCSLGKLWLGMDFGVSSLDLNNNITTFYDYRGDFGTGYTAILNDGIFYLGTNQGLYSSKWDDLNNNLEYYRFELIPETEGQVWTLGKIDGQLFMGHDRGLFIINRNAVEQLNNQEGVWTIIPFRDYLLTGNYNGISIFQKSGNTWLFEKKMDLIFGSCNQLIAENDSVLWVNIPNFGIIRAVLDDELYPVERLIFPMEVFDGHDVFVMKNEQGIHVLTDHHQYAYNNSEREFIKTERVKALPQIDDLLAGVFQPIALHPDYEFFPIYSGFTLRYIKPGAEPIMENPTLLLRRMEAFNNHDRVKFYPGAKMPYHINNVHLEVIVPNRKGVLYQYKLIQSGVWSDWQPDNTFELLGLKYGDYNLTVRASIKDQMSDDLQIAFRVAVPWYFSRYAYAVYFLLLGMTIYFLYRWQTITLKKQRKMMLIKEQNSLRQQTEKHKQEIMLIERKRLQTEYDQLKHQLKSKTIELAKKARDNEEKNRLILSLKEKCEKAQRNPVLFESKWREMQRILDSYLKIEDKTFEIQMDELHQEFFRQLKDKFPDLSNNDLRLCAYLKIGLNSKEIAELLNIQPSSFYISRSRLRKKLNLKPEEDLYSFLNDL